MQAAVLAFLSNLKGPPNLALLLLEFLSMWVSAVVFLTTLRLHIRYRNYMERARQIERELGMYLYEYSYQHFKSTPIPARHLGGNKTLWATLPFVTFVLVVALFLRHAYLWLSGAP
jgi:hypothetical protein